MKLKIKDVNNMDALIKDIDLLSGKKVRAGVLDEGMIGKIAYVNEYGWNIEVTPKMRAYLHAQGLHIKKETTHIKIPERSFIRSGYDVNREEFVKKAEWVISAALKRGIDIQTALDSLGIELQGILRQFLTDLKEPKNHPFTVEQKKSSNPLIDTGQLRSAIDYEVE